MHHPLLRLFFISVIFMFVYQLEARIFSYVYLFHEGLILIQSMLIGGGFFLMIRQLLSEPVREAVQRYTPLLITAAFFMQQFLSYRFNDFLLDFTALSVLFGLIFIEIANNIRISSNTFYATELIGSFVGIALYAIGVLLVLEEYLFIVLAVTVLVYTLVYTHKVTYRVPLLILASISTALYITILANTSILSLVHCSETSASYGYKAACLDDAIGLEPVASFTHLKGRSDIYIRENNYGVNALEMKNFGYFVSGANQEAFRDEEWFQVLEHRIPKLAYPDDARVIAAGAGVGSYIQALHAYIESPDITAVEIDRTVEDIYASGLFTEYLPSLDSYEIVYDEGRRYISFSDEQYDVITMAIEGVNSTLKKYVDERTGLLYTKEALETYIEHLTPGGYLVLEQYYPRRDGGDEMAVKFLRTLQAAAGEPDTVFSQNLFLYSWAFHPHPQAQRFIAGVYKPDGFSAADIATIQSWISEIQTTNLGDTRNPHDVRIIHSPEGFPNPVLFSTYFDMSQREQISAHANTELTTDDKPFRHFVTSLPLPPFSYAIFILLAAILLVLVGTLTHRGVVRSHQPILFSALSGVLTFGLQYLLFYKTAAFLHFNLIFFSIFLLVPLFFGAIGGYYSTRIRARTDLVLIGLFVVLSVLIATLDIFSNSRLIIFALIAGLFTLSGFLFPRILERSTDFAERSTIYAINLAAGGFAIAIMVTLHATIGWNMAFGLVSGLIVLSLLYLHKYVR